MEIQHTNRFYKSIIKPLLDFIISLLGFIILSPLFILIILFLAIANRGKVFFLQPRPGKGERIFRVIKFKTMNDRKDARGQLLPDEQRVTAVGKIVRKTSLDEIPQLLNVIKGDMSLVGPRPLLVDYLPLYNERQKLRHIVKPGITGWAQVNGRNALSWPEKFDFDVWYVEHMSFLTDVKIMFLTVLKVIKREDVNSATLTKFSGN
jgi:lipopolysaccharide/colanic/teichoic acid biosynthesis glycosyltransferase